MCFGRCAHFVGYKLLVLALLCFVANILLYFPNGETRYASQNHLSKYVECLHCIIGGGLLVLVPALVFIRLEHAHCHGCCDHEHCGKDWAMLASVAAAALGILGSGYCFIISALGLSYGPYCYSNAHESWCSPFTDSSGGYLLDHSCWSDCQEPHNVVQWNVTLFAILLILSGIELILCTIQVIKCCVGGHHSYCRGSSWGYGCPVLSCFVGSVSDGVAC
uniref:Transmembrane 4 L six family member 1 n=1 Tax=Sphenodon punctatus TaxID=8508 RepID=A0A8D0GQW2_SPHPU